jgi:hypothetical protein
MVVLRAKVGSIEEDLRNCASPSCGRSGTPEVPRQRWVEIESATTGGYRLVYIDERGWSFIETMHDSIDEAKAEAEAQYPIRGGWIEVDRDEDINVGSAQEKSLTRPAREPPSPQSQ